MGEEQSATPFRRNARTRKPPKRLDYAALGQPMMVRTIQDESVAFSGSSSSWSLRAASLCLAELKEMQRLEREEEGLVEVTQGVRMWNEPGSR